MYGKRVYVQFRNKLREVFIACEPDTPQETLEKRALAVLEKLAEKYKHDFEWAYEGFTKGYKV